MKELDITAWAGPRWAGVRAFTTERAGGVSQGPYAGLNLASHVGDAPDAVAANRARLRAHLPADPHWLEQVHGVAVSDADAGLAGVPCADAATTAQPGRVLAVLTADCLPVVIADRDARVLGVAHAGWRGLVSGVLEATVARLQAARGEAAWQAWIGPAIGPQAFEVGGEVRAAFADVHAEDARHFVARPDRAGKWLADLPALAAARLARCGVDRVERSGHCTVREDRYYSYRRDGVTGRIATLAWLTG